MLLETLPLFRVPEPELSEEPPLFLLALAVDPLDLDAPDALDCDRIEAFSLCSSFTDCEGSSFSLELFVEEREPDEPLPSE